ncbi:hypothetical protein BJY22_005327 [Kribbella shirazensis]|uniref:Beta-lactamase-related domain-containing protein n=1 Tax=Kribbella shirazensis TaxID=1105143 RepID=A0A7X5VE75_9ACTN|nr:hypothetical protein [Kribbella shirazensis]
MPFHEFVRRSLFGPLALDRTSFDARVFLREADRAIGHSTGARRVPARGPMVAAGGLYTSVDDACRYLQFHIAGGSLLSPALFAEMYQGDQGYGLGIALTRANDVPVRGHSGGGFGFLSDMYWAPEAGLGVVVLTNSTAHPLQWKLASEVLRELVGDGTPRRHASLSRGSVPAATLSGDYVDSDQVSLIVEAGEAFLVSGDTRKPAEFVSPHEFWVDDQLYRFRDLDRDGHPTYLESVHDGHVRYRNDVPEPAPAEAGGPWNRDYAIRVSGVREGTARLRKENGAYLLDHWSGSTLRLREHLPSLYVSSTGEALDLTRTPPTYANVQLHQL